MSSNSLVTAGVNTQLMTPIFPDTIPAYQIDDIRDFLEQKVRQYNCPDFIEHDPVSIPHMFKLRQDIEIMGFWAAMLSWGQRKTILNKSRELIELMGGSPYDFIMNHQERDLAPLMSFRHRTFNATDTLYFIEFLRNHYTHFASLEDAFIRTTGTYDAENGLNGFRNYFFTGDFPRRTMKHVSWPEGGSTCKRLNMFLRWMVRDDQAGVDFGIWKKIPVSSLMIPLDLHVDRVGRKLGLISRRQCDWKTVIELTGHLAAMDPVDPSKYDFALFNLGIEEKFPFGPGIFNTRTK